MPPPIAQRISLLRPTTVNSILADVAACRKAGGQPVSLMRGEPDLATPPHIVEAAIAALRAGRTGYPQNLGEPRLREAVAAKLQRDQGVAYAAENEILITTGATLGILAALFAVLDPGDEVLTLDPIYDAYRSPVALSGGILRAVPAQIVDGRFQIDPAALEAAVTPRTRAILLNTPWNPVGTVCTRQELQAVVEIAVRHNLILISDEIYETIVYDGRTHISPASLGNARERTILVNSFSKTYAMTGWRLGYCAAPPAILAAMYLVLQQSSRGPATFVQDAGAVALAGPQDCVAAMQAEYAARRRQVAEVLADIPRVRALLPEGGFFLMLDVRGLGLSAAEISRRLLSEYEVVVVPGSAYGPTGEGTLRVSFASGGAALEAGLARLRAGLMALSAER